VIEFRRSEPVEGVEFTSWVEVPEDWDAEVTVRVADLRRWLEEAGYQPVWS
jgi:hypothetical protein